MSEPTPARPSRKVLDSMGPGHVLADEPGMVQGDSVRWDCKVCDCIVWDRPLSDLYGSLLTTACSTLVGRGRLSCDGCGGWWDWPGTFGDERGARNYMAMHRCGASNMRIEVFFPAKATVGKGSQVVSE